MKDRKCCEKRRQKALEREAEARANSQKSNEEDDMGNLMPTL